MNLKIFLIQFKTWVWWAFTPPFLRNAIMLAWGKVLMTSKDWTAQSIFQSYMLNSAPVNSYSPSATYTTGTNVVYWINGYNGDNGVYQSLSINADGSNNAGFINKPPIIGNIVPDVMPANITDPDSALLWLSGYYWIKVAPDPIGVMYRASFNSQKLLFEYALNKWFNTTFRQPSVGVSDIYITRNNISLSAFFIAPVNNNSFVGPGTYFAPAPVVTKFIAVSDPVNQQNNFTINIPLAVYNNLSSNASLRQPIIRAFADRLNRAGAYYNIITY